MDTSDILNLKGQIALVTGAGQGAGRTTALLLAQHNAGGVIVNDFDPDKAAAVAQEIRALGVPAEPAAADVGNYQALADALNTAKGKVGSPNLLINNAGNAGPQTTMRPSPLFWETEPSEWDRFFHTNLKGVMNCCHLVIPDMVAAGSGRIVTIVSDAGRVGESRLAVYSAAKAGAAGFMRSIAKEAGRHGITANCISLSTLEPQLEEPARSEFLNSDRAKAHVQRYAIRRFGRNEDVANMALYLCSDAAEWITGQTYPVNGGYSFAQ